MNSHESRVWDNPGEERLASLMQSASEKLFPQDGYSLSMNLHGVMSDMATFKDLESRFGFSLDREWGSNMQLNLTDGASTLELSHLTMQMAENVGQVDLQKINPGHSMPYQYLPEIDFRGERIEASRFAWDPEWQDELSSKLLSGHRLDPDLSPINSAEDFRMRIGHNILSHCNSWFIKERLLLSQHMLGEAVVRMSIARQQNVSENIEMSRDVLSIIQENESLQNDSRVLVSRQKLDLVSQLHSQRFMLTTYTESKVRSRTIPGRNSRQARHYHAEPDTIAEFTSLFEPSLGND